MNCLSQSSSQKGTVLVLALWSLGLLTIFAVGLGAKTRQEIILAGRLEDRARLYYAAEAGIKKSVALLKMEANGKALSKTTLFNNPTLFREKTLGFLVFDVMHPEYDGPRQVYGIVDEERKININKADEKTLQRLFLYATDLSEEGVRKLADAIIDWREYGESQAGGFQDQELFYPEKKGDFETIDELALVKGMTKDIYQQILPFVTIYGKGAVNINSAPWEVLAALGLSKVSAQKVARFRQGPDKKEGSADDVVFPGDGRIVGMLADILEDEPEEIDDISKLFLDEKITAQSSFFMIQSHGYTKGSTAKKVITCVFNLNDNKINYWREEN